MNPDDKFKPVEGLHSHRLDPKQNNPREVAFAQQWDEEDGRYLIQQLMIVPAEKGEEGAARNWSVLFGQFEWNKQPLGEITERDRILVKTMMQWLGSNVGMGFLHEALKRCGYRLEQDKPLTHRNDARKANL